MTVSAPTIEPKKKPSAFYGFVAWVVIVELIIGLGIYSETIPTLFHALLANLT